MGNISGREKHRDLKTASKCNRKNTTNTNILKLKKVQNKLASMYLKEQGEYMQNQTDTDSSNTVVKNSLKSEII